MRRFSLYIILFCCVLAQSFSYACENCNVVKENEIKIQKLEIENVTYKTKFDVYVSESDKRMALFTTLSTSVVGLLIIIYGFGAFRSTQLAKQEARKAILEDFEKTKLELENLKQQAETLVEEIKVLKDVGSGGA